MKYFFALMVCIMVNINVMLAQEEKGYMDWAIVKEVAEEKPEIIKDLAKRMVSTEPDTLLSVEDYVLAFYGYTYIAKAEDWALVNDAFKSYRDKKYAEAIAKAKKVLEVNPVNPRAYYVLAYSIADALDDNQNIGYTKDEGQHYYDCMMRCFAVIYSTGDGTQEHPFYVTSVHDEYDFLGQFLKIWNVNKQALVGHCDVLYFDETSEYYNHKEAYFEITRVLELERIAFMK